MTDDAMVCVVLTGRPMCAVASKTAAAPVSAANPCTGSSEGGEGMAFWRDKLFAVLARNAADMTDFLSIPTNRVIEMGTLVEL